MNKKNVLSERKCVCTISTRSHLFKSKALVESLNSFNFSTFVLIIDEVFSDDIEMFSSEEFRTLNDLNSPIVSQLIKKYQNYPDKLRWSLKPIFTKYLLENGYDQVIYVDNDIFFYSSPDFLFEKLETSSFLLTPHFYKALPNKNQNWLEANYRVGLYNAGFFGVNKNATPILDWWAECCLYNVKIAYWRGLYLDQKYLDLVPVIFDNVEVVKHRGCNFAGWNCDEVLIEEKENQLYINDDKLVFIHFSPLSVERFSNKQSAVYSSFQKYLIELQNHKSNFEFKGKKRTLAAFSTYFYYLRWKCLRLFEN